MQGDSCIEANPAQFEGRWAIWWFAAMLQALRLPHASTISRAWHYTDIGNWNNAWLQICRLKRQTIQLLDTAPYQHLLSDEHQQAALKMVMQQWLSIITGARNRQNLYAGPYYRGTEPDDS